MSFSKFKVQVPTNRRMCGINKKCYWNEAFTRGKVDFWIIKLYGASKPEVWEGIACWGFSKAQINTAHSNYDVVVCFDLWMNPMGVEVICGFPTTMSATNFDDFFVGSAVACHNMGKSIESKCSFRFLRDHDSAAPQRFFWLMCWFCLRCFP